MARSRVSLPWAIIGLLALATASSAQSDFGFYPEGAQDCLYRAAARTDCEDSGNVPEMNACFCSNGDNFIINVASCVGEESEDDVQNTYAVMQDACSNSDTPMSVSQSDFFAAANGEDVNVSNDQTSTTTTSEPTSTETDSTSTQTESTGTETESQEPTATESEDLEDNSNGEDDNGGGLSQGATIGIGVGAGVAGLALIGALAAFLLRRRKRQSEESNPMLPTTQFNKHSPTTFPPQSPSPGFAAFTDAKTSPSVSPYSAHNTHSGAWQSPPLFQGQQQQHGSSPQPYPPQPYQAYAPHAPVEIDGVPQHVVEMPGSTPPTAGRL